MKYLVIITLSILFAGCMTPKKAVDVLSRPKNEPVAAEFCSTKYPIKETYVQGDSIVKYDTLWGIVTDTLISEPQVLVYRDTVRVPKLVTKTITRIDTVKKEDPARISVLGRQISILYDTNYNLTKRLEKVTTEWNEYKSKLIKARLINWILYVVIGLSIGIWIRKKFKLF